MFDSSDSSFIGKGWAFPPRFSVEEGSNAMVKGAQDIAESLLVLMSTVPGQRVMFPDYGCGVKKLLFSEVSVTQFTIIKNTIRNAILLYEPRIDVNEITITPDSSNIDLLYVNIDYQIRETNTRSNLVYPFYFAEGTSVSPKLIK